MWFTPSGKPLRRMMLCVLRTRVGGFLLCELAIPVALTLFLFFLSWGI